MSILITGASGFLGEKFLEDLCEKKDDTKIYLLLRGDNLEKFSQKYAKNNRVFCVEGDLTNPDVFEDQNEFKHLSLEITQIFHLAALYDLEAPKEQLVKVNVIGTQNLLFFAGYCKNLKKFNYASSIAVAGDFKGPFSEDDFDLNQSFNDPYAYSKFKAEEVVRNWFSKSQVCTQILRFGIIIGDSKSGEFKKKDGIYYFLKALIDINRYAGATFKAPYLGFPYDGDQELPLVTVDTASRALLDVYKNKKGGLRSYHILNRDLPTLRDFLEDFVKHLGYQPQFMSLPRISLFEPLIKNGLYQLGLPQELIDYMYIKPQFTRIKMDQDLKITNPSYNDFKEVIFDRAVADLSHTPLSVYPQVIQFLSRCEKAVVFVKGRIKA